jgi:hypothetical protein
VGAKQYEVHMSFILDPKQITAIADKAEKLLSVPGYRNRSPDRGIIENAIREALIEQAQELIKIVPASAVSTAALLNLGKLR